jgi:hypothetical protein
MLLLNSEEGAVMQRRELMNTLLAAGTISAVSAQATAGPPLRTTTPSSKRTAVAPFIETLDGTHLYWTQWGVGRPILFLNSAGMTTQMWDYQDMDNPAARSAATTTIRSPTTSRP